MNSGRSQSLTALRRLEMVRLGERMAALGDAHAAAATALAHRAKLNELLQHAPAAGRSTGRDLNMMASYRAGLANLERQTVLASQEAEAGLRESRDTWATCKRRCEFLANAIARQERAANDVVIPLTQQTNKPAPLSRARWGRLSKVLP